MISLIINLLLISQSFSHDLYVGYPGKGKNFETIQDAIDEAAALNPRDELERVKIHIAPGLYRQQLKIETPFITLLNEEPEKEVKITWYYGVGYKYYSVGTDGLYNATRAMEKSVKTPSGGRWSATVHLFWRAVYFRAENIIFENSFNRYITQEEIEDGVEVSMETEIRTIRNETLDPNTRSATERAAAFSAEGDFCEFLNCQFLSSQDTLYTGSSPQYYKNCLIEGQTDYIFGGSNAVFDSCYLSWKGYSEGSLGGYITAALDGKIPYTGYVFYNCTVIGNKNLTVKTGALGRPWRPTAKVTYINTILESEDMISEEGWGPMSCAPEEVEGFFEYGTRLANGKLVDLSKRKGHIIEKINFNEFDLRTYMNDWTPYYYTSISLEDTYEWGSLKIGGGGFISGLVVGLKEMYLRTDVGGAYKYDYNKKEWIQLFSFLNEEKKGYLSVKGIAIDPNDDDIVYFLCGCGYFYPYKTAIYKTTDGGKSFTETEISDFIEVHGNGVGRECTEPISVDPDNSNIIYVGGDVAASDSALIKSTDGGITWKAVKGYDNLGFFKYQLKWPTWTNHLVRGISDANYSAQSGINWVKIIDGKIYVGTSIIGEPNIHVAEVGKDEFTVLSEDLPTKNYPLSVKYDGNGNLIFTYIKNVKFDGSAGGAFKYNILTKKVTDISPIDNAIGITIDRDDPNKLVARTAAVWRPQWWGKTNNNDMISYGDKFYRSTDGGLSWTDITPGQKTSDNENFISLELKDNGYEWIKYKSIHWGPGIEIDPRNPNKILLTSGNGLWTSDNIWDEKEIQFYFDPNGIEEVVPLDMISIKGGDAYSTILDFDGFIHKGIDKGAIQYTPNMGATSSISACNKNPKIMMRISNNEDKAFYSENGGLTWTEMVSAGGFGGGKGAITLVGDEKYRFLHASSDKIVYSDNFGRTWEECTGIVGENINILVEESDPMIVYAYSSTKKSDSNPKPQNILGVSGDGGKTFVKKVISDYDGSDFSNRIAYISEGKIALAAGKKGLYIISHFGQTIERAEAIEYCKTIGFGTPEKINQENTLYMYGRPSQYHPEGLYRSYNSGKTWALINYKQLYGGTGNGNFVVGDMNTFGTLYMSTVGLGIIYGKLK